MYILGISGFYHDSAACILKDGELMAAAQEERFTRIKNDPAFPASAIKYCIEFCGVSLSAIDHIVFYEKPFLKFERLLETFFAFAPWGIKSYLAAMPVWLKEKLFLKKSIIKALRNIDGNWKYIGDNLLFTTHHQSHAASAFFPSPYHEAIILTMDGVGEWTTASIMKGSGNSIDTLKEIKFPHSIGLLYSAFTYYLGFKVNSDEYKVMGLAPYGEPRYADLILEKLADVKSDGSFRLNMDYFNYATGLTMTNDKFDRLFGRPRREPADELNLFHADIARSIQQVTEEIVVKIANNLYREYGIKNLCLAGGVALNCVVNGKLLRDTPFENIWVQPAAGDAGGAIGAAYAAYYSYLGNTRNETKAAEDKMKNALLGPAFTSAEIKNALVRHKLLYHEFDEEPFYEKAAQLIEAGNVMGWFNGRMEFGPRALGARSIIADPRNSKMQSVINQKIKFRESFRPFAPAILEEHTQEYFDLKQTSPYMLFTAHVSKQQLLPQPDGAPALNGFERLKQINSTIPAVTHVDNSARVQTVNASTPEFYRLIMAFYKITGCPLVVNTSFNVMDEPIVCTPDDAIRCFLNIGMDVLAFKNIIVYKKEITT